MKIISQLYILSIVFILLILMVLFALFHAANETKRDIQLKNHIFRIIKDTSDLNLLINEFLRYHEVRMQQQLLLKHEALGRSIKIIAEKYAHPKEHQKIYELIENNYKRLDYLFSELQLSITENKLTEEKKSVPISKEIYKIKEEFLADEIMITFRLMTSEVIEFSSMLNNEILQSDQRNHRSILIILVGFTVFMFYTFFVINKNIRRPILNLTKAAKIIGQGNLTHRVDIKAKNEIGRLGDAFNYMAERRAEAEDQIKASLKEKEVLLREIHHRVKNNMQVVSSLLMLQSEYLNDEKDIELFKESQNRIKSMAIIHESLYQSVDLAKIDFKVYVKKMSDGLLRSYNINNNKIALKIDIKDVSLGVDTAIPCSLIINELISNSIKYAFPFGKSVLSEAEGLRASSIDSAEDKSDGKKGKIKIFMSKKKDGEIELIVADNGVSIPNGLDFRNTKTLGLQLVTDLAEDQLDGKIELNISKGTEFRIRFKELQHKKRF